MLQIENLSYSIGDKKLLNEIHLNFTPNKLHLILGANGAGKSTLLKIIAGQTKNFVGKVHFGKKEISSYSAGELAKNRSVLSQQLELSFPLSVHEIVLMGRYPHFSSNPTKEDIRIVDEVMEFFEITSFSTRVYHTLSGGEQQRVQFARVVCQLWDAPHSSRLLLLDEPLTFLDISYQHAFMRKMKRLIEEQRFTVVGVIHDISLALQYADSISMLKKGNLLASGTTKSVATEENILSAFDITTEIYERNGRLVLEVL